MIRTPILKAAAPALTFQLGAHLVGSLLDVSCQVLQFLLGLCREIRRIDCFTSVRRNPTVRCTRHMISPENTGRLGDARGKGGSCGLLWEGRSTLHSLSSGLGAAKMALCCFFTSSTSSESFSMHPRISSTWAKVHRGTYGFSITLVIAK